MNKLLGGNSIMQRTRAAAVRSKHEKKASRQIQSIKIILNSPTTSSIPTNRSDAPSYLLYVRHKSLKPITPPPKYVSKVDHQSLLQRFYLCSIHHPNLPSIDGSTILRRSPLQH
ncbi:hypothetical protein PGT21_028375 [Puccinia graminis f. sp. tritici]|uniref:Uncharacterized protein n=1 Tax=Puccinia graminis f. sp. tritici TaxID=56615 RepID=A0A5B0PYU4_PUCGR|nr:hypothetical protein PGT21_028375 [Puccinia graminis f. sp. tritici]KAA1129827.1 hypothetical protein PGTUg99_003197 [Puccinia graminis f. sp. tritici]